MYKSLYVHLQKIYVEKLSTLQILRVGCWIVLFCFVYVSLVFLVQLSIVDVKFSCAACKVSLLFTYIEVWAILCVASLQSPRDYTQNNCAFISWLRILKSSFSHAFIQNTYIYYIFAQVNTNTNKNTKYFFCDKNETSRFYFYIKRVNFVVVINNIQDRKKWMNYFRVIDKTLIPGISIGIEKWKKYFFLLKSSLK